MISKEQLLLEELEQKKQQVINANIFKHQIEALYEFNEYIHDSFTSIIEEMDQEADADYKELNTQIKSASSSINKAAKEILKHIELSPLISQNKFWLEQPESYDIGALYMRCNAINDIIKTLITTEHAKLIQHFVILNNHGEIQSYLYFTNQEALSKEMDHIHRMGNVRAWGSLNRIRGLALIYNPRHTKDYVDLLSRNGCVTQKLQIELRQDALNKLIGPGHYDPTYEGSFDIENIKHHTEKIFLDIKNRVNKKAPPGRAGPVHSSG